MDPHHYDVDPDADPDAYPDFYLMRMRIQVTKMMRIHADTDPGPQHCFNSNPGGYYKEH